jgi:hypothetical protein
MIHGLTEHNKELCNVMNLDMNESLLKLNNRYY